MLTETKQQSVLKMGRDETLGSENNEKRPEWLKEYWRKKVIEELPIGKRKVPDDPERRQRYLKATSREKLEIEDEVIVDFFTNSRRRRGFVGRHPAAKATVAPLNQLERLIDKNIDRIRGRPKYERIKVLLYFKPDYVKYIDDYAQKCGHDNRQAAIKWIVRDFLRSNGYPVA
jgi:hypothetical protein